MCSTLHQITQRLLTPTPPPDALFSLEATLIASSLTVAHPREANRIDALMTKGQLLAQSRCCKLCMGQVQISEATILPQKCTSGN